MHYHALNCADYPGQETSWWRCVRAPQLAMEQLAANGFTFQHLADSLAAMAKAARGVSLTLRKLVNRMQAVRGSKVRVVQRPNSALSRRAAQQ
jgi:hypothetical protein